MPDSPDPVADAQAYQRHLLGLVGAADPAVVQAATGQQLRQLATDGGARLRLRPAPGEWSVLGCLAHIFDAEIVSSGRYRWVLAHDLPPLVGYDQDLWVDRLHSEAETAEELLAVFEPLRQANISLWQRSNEEQRARVGIHGERGPESFDLLFRMIAGHDVFHLDQIRRTLVAVEA